MAQAYFILCINCCDDFLFTATVQKHQGLLHKHTFPVKLCVGLFEDSF